jgi:hypothetical protein
VSKRREGRREEEEERDIKLGEGDVMKEEKGERNNNNNTAARATLSASSRLTQRLRRASVAPTPP